MTFGDAIEALKSGKRIARKGWNGKGMYLVLSAGSSSHSILVGAEHATKITTTNPYILIFTAEGLYQPGWLASQADILAEDWVTVLDPLIEKIS
jgi:hypothetical protein